MLFSYCIHRRVEVLKVAVNTSLCLRWQLLNDCVIHIFLKSVSEELCRRWVRVKVWYLCASVYNLALFSENLLLWVIYSP